MDSTEPETLRHEQLAFSTGITLPQGQDFLTPVIQARAPFFEALVSWNARVPKSAGMSVELRVRETEQYEWSPWLFVGEWGAVPEERERTIEFGGGRIDVDYFAGSDEFGELQLRFDVYGRGTVELSRFDLCLTGAGPMREHKAGAERGYVSLEVPPRSQRTEEASLADRVCSPTTVAMMLEYRGVSVPTSVVAEKLYDVRHDIYGNWTRAIQGAFEFGVPGYLTRFSDWESVEAVLRSGQPLVASIRTPEGGLTGAPYVSTAGHLVVIVGFDEAGNLLVNDPAASSAEEVRLLYPRAEMERAWMGKGGLAYVFLQPE